MAQSKEEVKYGTAKAKLSDDETLRVRYKHGTPLEGGKIADSDPVDLYSSAKRVQKPENKSGGGKERTDKSRPITVEEEEEATSRGDGGGI